MHALHPLLLSALALTTLAIAATPAPTCTARRSGGASLEDPLLCPTDEVCLDGAVVLAGNYTPRYTVDVLVLFPNSSLDLPTPGSSLAFAVGNTPGQACPDNHLCSLRNPCQGASASSPAASSVCQSRGHTQRCACPPSTLGQYCELNNPCGAGERLDGATLDCVAATQCDFGTEIIAAHPTLSTDRACAPRNVSCPPRHWARIEAGTHSTVFPDAACVPWDEGVACPPGQYRRNATAAHDYECHACPAGTFQPSSGFQGSACRPWTFCSPGFGQLDPDTDSPSAVRDQTCQTCDKLGSGELLQPQSNYVGLCQPVTAASSWLDSHLVLLVSLICTLVGVVGVIVAVYEWGHRIWGGREEQRRPDAAAIETVVLYPNNGLNPDQPDRYGEAAGARPAPASDSKAGGGMESKGTPTVLVHSDNTIVEMSDLGGTDTDALHVQAGDGDAASLPGSIDEGYLVVQGSADV